MLDSFLYDISQISKRLTTIGFSVKEIDSNMVQMGDKQTTIYVKRSEGYILFATQSLERVGIKISLERLLIMYSL